MLFREYLVKFGHTLDVELAKSFFRWLVGYVDAPGTIKILRQYGKQWGRARLFVGADGTRLVFGDNEPAVWCFTGLWQGEDLSHSLARETLIERICICDSRGSGESDHLLPYNFRQRTKSWNVPGGIDHKHIFDVKEQSISFPPHEVTSRTAKNQMLRYLAPMNHFLMPRYCTNAAERGSMFQAVAAWFMHQRYGDTYLELLARSGVENSEEFLALGRAQSDVLDLPEPVMSEPTPVHDRESAANEPLIRALAPNEHAAFKMTIGGDGRLFSTRALPPHALDRTYTLEIASQNGPGARVEPVGRFALNLRRMLDEGLVRIEKQKKKGEAVRLIVQQRGAEFYVQLNKDAPCLRVPMTCSGNFGPAET